MHKQQILAIGLSEPEFEYIAPFLDRAEFEADRFPSAQGALELLEHLSLDLLLVRYPLPEVALDDFLRQVREPRVPSHKASIVLITDADHVVEADRYVGRGANKVALLDHSSVSLQDAICSVLHIAPRRAARFLAQLQVKIGRSADSILCLAHNSSATGALLETPRDLATGTQVDFEFTLPDQTDPVIGRGEVVRKAIPERDQIAGIGVRFLSFRGSSQRNFHSFLSRQADS